MRKVSSVFEGACLTVVLFCVCLCLYTCVNKRVQYKYEVYSSNGWNYHVQSSVVCVGYKQQLKTDPSEACTRR